MVQYIRTLHTLSILGSGFQGRRNGAITITSHSEIHSRRVMRSGDTRLRVDPQTQRGVGLGDKPRARKGLPRHH